MEPVKDYYASFGQREWSRLAESDDGYVEFTLTCRQLALCLKPRSKILDLGGGPGRYALWLAEQGHQVVLADLSPDLLAIARAKISASPHAARITEICETDARDLARWADGAFDAVLCLGPLYHLPDEADRVRVFRELHRVLKPAGLLFAAFIARLSFLRRTLLIPDERVHFMDDRWLKSLREDGCFQNSVPGRFTHGYGANPSELGPQLATFGFQQVSLMAVESIAGGIGHNLSALQQTDPALHDKIMDTLFAVAAEPSILGFYGHLLYTGKKQAA